MTAAVLRRFPLDGNRSPEAVLCALREDDRPFALTGRWAGGGAVLGSDPVMVAGEHEDPFAVLEQLPDLTGEIPEAAVGGGWFGYLGYGLGSRVEELRPAPPRPVPLPAFSLAYYDHVLRLDGSGRWWFEGLWTPEAEPRLRARLALMRARLAAPPARADAYACGSFHVRPERAGHMEAVRRCREYIAAGDLFQANVCLRLDAPFEGEALDLFATAAPRLSPDYAAYLRGPWGEVASLSPELFLRRHGRAVTTLPIKGTRRRSADAAEATRLRDALSGSAKDVAENVMIVDLMRNDLGRVCDTGSVTVPSLAEAQAHPGVWHLVSEVRGSLRDGLGDAALLRASFPPGSVTGAPKIKAMEVISTLEGTGRETYTGAIGYASPACGLELNVAIRTFEVAGGTVWLGAGGGIVADSDPAAEFDECLVKAAPLLAAAGAGLARHRRHAIAPGLPAPTRHPRPDPALGLLETILCVDGLPQELHGHLQRLETSARSVYGVGLPPNLRYEVLDAVAAHRQLARVRLRLDPRGDVRIEREPVRAEQVLPASRLSPVPLVVPGGIGAHKWADRRLLAGAEALICDLDGEVLETSSGSIFLVEGDTLVTPRADGRILPGVTRDVVLSLAEEDGLEVAEEAVDLPRLRAADSAFVTSAIRGLQPLAGYDPRPARHIAGLLRRRWGLELALAPELAAA